MPAYATLADLTALGLRSAALAGISPVHQQQALEAASRVADSYLQARYTLPLSAWGIDLTRAVATIAAYDLLAVRGFAPEGADDHVRLRHEDAIRWLRDVSLGVVTPVGIVDANPTTASEGIHAVTEPRRW